MVFVKILTLYLLLKSENSCHLTMLLLTLLFPLQDLLNMKKSPPLLTKHSANYLAKVNKLTLKNLTSLLLPSIWEMMKWPTWTLVSSTMLLPIKTLNISPCTFSENFWENTELINTPEHTWTPLIDNTLQCMLNWDNCQMSPFIRLSITLTLTLHYLEVISMVMKSSEIKCSTCLKWLLLNSNTIFPNMNYTEPKILFTITCSIMTVVLTLPKNVPPKLHIWTEEYPDLNSPNVSLTWTLDSYKELLINGSGILKYLLLFGDPLMA